MINRVIDLFERLVVAIERLAAAQEKLAHPLMASSGDVIDITAEVNGNKGQGENPEESTEPDNSPPPEETVKQKRERLKKELTALGIEFSPKTATKTLESKLASAKALKDKEDEKGGSDDPKTVSLNELHKALREHALTIKSPKNEKTYAILEKVGKTNKSSELTEAQRVEAYKLIKEELAKVKK